MRRIPYLFCLMFMCVAGCGGGGGGSGSSTATQADALNHFTGSNFSRNLVTGSVPDCSSTPSLQFVTPSGQLYPCVKFVIQFTPDAASTNSGTYRVGTGFAHTALGETELESGTWKLTGHLLTCTAASGATIKTASGFLDAPDTPAFPGYAAQVKFAFTTGPYTGQTVTYFNINNPV